MPFRLEIGRVIARTLITHLAPSDLTTPSPSRALQWQSVTLSM